MPLLYPDVIKLDLRLLDERDPEDVARIVTAVGAEAERRHATVLAEGIDSEEQLATARAAGATLGQGYLLGEPAPLPAKLPNPGRGLRLTSSGGVPDNVVPFQRVTNWRRPADGPPSWPSAPPRCCRPRRPSSGSTGLLLAATPDDDPLPAAQLERYVRLAREIGFVGVLGGSATDAGEGLRGGRLPDGDPLRGTWTEVALGPGYGACFVARRDGRRRRWQLRDLLRPRDGGRVRGRADGADAVAGGGLADPRASSAITSESWLPCQAIGELPGLLASAAPRPGSPRA